MDPPDDAIAITEGIVWLENGVIFVQTNGVSGTRESAIESFGVLRDLLDGELGLLLFDARKWPGGTVAAWTTGLGALKPHFTAVAMLIDPENPPGPSPMFLDRLPIPFQVFTDEAESLAFLREFPPNE